MGRSPDLAVEAAGLAKSFGATRAVNGVDLAVPAGSVYGVLGPNGAGKTTTLRMLATLLTPDAGTARVLGHNVVTQARQVRARISLTGQFASVDEDLTGAENLVLLARLIGYPGRRARARAEELLTAFGLSEAAGRQVKRYSGGMQRRLDVAASLLVTPEVLFLDEPTTGLDPGSRSQVWEIIRAVAAAGTTVMLTTQYLDEADRLAARIAVFGRGTVIAEGTSADLKASAGDSTLHVRLADPATRERAREILAAALRVPVQRAADPAALSARLPAGRGDGRPPPSPCAGGGRPPPAPGWEGPEPAGRAAGALTALTGAGVPVSAFALGQPSLDEVFLALTARDAGEVPTDSGAPA